MLKKLLLAAAIAGLSSSAAMADHLITVTWTGKIAGGTDVFNAFGGGDMTGVDFTSSLVFNATQANYQLGTATLDGTVYPFFSQYTDGPVSASFTIGTTTMSFSGNSYSYVGATNQPAEVWGPNHTAQFESDAIYSDGNFYQVLFHRVSASGQDEPWADLGLGDYDGDVSGVDSSPGSNFFMLADFSTMTIEQLTLVNQHLTIVNSVDATPSPTPEPVSWAMMVSGFGLVGGAMRSRRKATIRFA